MADETKPEDLSDIPPVEVPNDGFASEVPPYLLANKSEAEQYIITSMSQMSAYIKWSAPILVESNKSIRITNGRVKSLEAWRAVFQSWWALALGGFAIIGGIAGAIEVLDFLLKLKG